jgi:hypothetical protein
MDSDTPERSTLLRGFDQQVAAENHDTIFRQGVDFRIGFLPSAIAKEATTGQLHAVYANTGTGESYTGPFNTLLDATGRTAKTHGLELAKADVHVLPNSKFETEAETTSVPHIHTTVTCSRASRSLRLRPSATICAVYTKKMNYDLVDTRRVWHDRPDPA